MRTERKYPAIDLFKLKSTYSTAQWNRVLTRRLVNKDLDGLVAIRYGLQAGMDDLAKHKMNTEEMQDLFIRLQRSVEITMRKIWRLKYPNPCDDPLKAADNLEHQEAKRERDAEFNRFLKRTGY